MTHYHRFSTGIPPSALLPSYQYSYSSATLTPITHRLSPFLSSKNDRRNRMPHDLKDNPFTRPGLSGRVILKNHRINTQTSDQFNYLKYNQRLSPERKNNFLYSSDHFNYTNFQQINHPSSIFRPKSKILLRREQSLQSQYQQQEPISHIILGFSGNIKNDQQKNKPLDSNIHKTSYHTDSVEAQQDNKFLLSLEQKITLEYNFILKKIQAQFKLDSIKDLTTLAKDFIENSPKIVKWIFFQLFKKMLKEYLQENPAKRTLSNGFLLTYEQVSQQTVEFDDQMLIAKAIFSELYNNLYSITSIVNNGGTVEQKYHERCKRLFVEVYIIIEKKIQNQKFLQNSQKLTQKRNTQRRIVHFRSQSHLD